MIIGFTGTRHGMTDRQRASLATLLRQHHATVLHHGCCVGADAQAHRLALRMRIQLHRHPPLDARYLDHTLTQGAAEEPLDYHARNHAIVDACSLLIAAPQSSEERLYSGTWSTVRYARRQHCAIKVLAP